MLIRLYYYSFIQCGSQVKQVQSGVIAFNHATRAVNLPILKSLNLRGSHMAYGRGSKKGMRKFLDCFAAESAALIMSIFVFCFTEY